MTLKSRLHTQVVTPLVWSTYFLILVFRGRSALDRIPSDQGYGIFESARQGFRADAFLVPYFNLLTQSVPYIIAPLPIVSHAIATSILVHAIWAVCGLIIFLSFRHSKLPFKSAYLAGLALVAVPYSSESALGNPGILGFALLTTSVVISAHRPVINDAPRTSAAFGLITGLTSPLGFLAVVPTLIRALHNHGLCRKELLFAFAVMSTLPVNLLVIGLSEAAEGRSGKIGVMWNGAGIFWWSGWTGPPAIAVFVLVICFLGRRKVGQFADSITGLSLASISIAASSYLLGGIGDRYFIAPAVLSVLSLLLLSHSIPRFNLSVPIRFSVISIISVTLLVPAAKWFSAGWYLTGGPTWSSEVKRAEALCLSTEVDRVELQISPNGTQNLSCKYLMGDN